MENLIEHEGKKYRVVQEPSCKNCVFEKTLDVCRLIWRNATTFPDCSENDCHFELVEETNPKE
jgi:hypothetical protein